MFLSERYFAAPLGATPIMTTTAAMLGAVVAAVAGAALAPAILPPAHAAAGEPGTLAFEFGSLGHDAGELQEIQDIAVGPDGRIVVADGIDGIEVFHPNGTFAFKVGDDELLLYSTVAVGTDGRIVANTLSYAYVFHPNGTLSFRIAPEGTVITDV